MGVARVGALRKCQGRLEGESNESESLDQDQDLVDSENAFMSHPPMSVSLYSESPPYREVTSSILM
jgi:hypothetical protein